MPIFVMLTRLTPQELHQPRSYETLERHVAQHVRSECKDVRWIANYAVLGPWDYLDVFEAPDIEAATRVSVLARTFGHAQTEIWPALEWGQFKSLVHGLPASREHARTTYPWPEAV
jgi:uncharacterized protein with GYD domain